MSLLKQINVANVDYDLSVKGTDVNSGNATAGKVLMSNGSGASIWGDSLPTIVITEEQYETDPFKFTDEQYSIMSNNSTVILDLSELGFGYYVIAKNAGSTSEVLQFAGISPVTGSGSSPSENYIIAVKVNASNKQGTLGYANQKILTLENKTSAMTQAVGVDNGGYLYAKGYTAGTGISIVNDVISVNLENANGQSF